MEVTSVEEVRAFLKSQLEKTGISQAKFAKQINFPASNISNFLSGSKIPNLLTFLKLIEGLGLKVSIEKKEIIPSTGRKRIIIKELALEGKSIGEIVELTGQSRSVVNSHLHVIRKTVPIKKCRGYDKQEFVHLVNSDKTKKEICDLCKISRVSFYVRVRNLEKKGFEFNFLKRNKSASILDKNKEQILTMIKEGYKFTIIAQKVGFPITLLKNGVFYNWRRKQII